MKNFYKSITALTTLIIINAPLHAKVKTVVREIPISAESCSMPEVISYDEIQGGFYIQSKFKKNICKVSIEFRERDNDSAFDGISKWEVKEVKKKDGDAVATRVVSDADHYRLRETESLQSAGFYPRITLSKPELISKAKQASNQSVDPLDKALGDIEKILDILAPDDGFENAIRVKSALNINKRAVDILRACELTAEYENNIQIAEDMYFLTEPEGMSSSNGHVGDLGSISVDLNRARNGKEIVDRIMEVCK